MMIGAAIAIECTGTRRLAQRAPQHRYPDPMADAQQLSQAAFDRLKAEHDDLTTRGRIDIARKIEAARELAGCEGIPSNRPAGGSEITPIRTPWSIEPEDPISFDFYERQAIVRALHACRGDRIAAARMLRVGKSTLYRKIRRFGIE